MGPTGGSISNISSIVGPMPVDNASVYRATRAAVAAGTIALSKGLGPKKIRMNSLNPGVVETEGLHARRALGNFPQAFTHLARISAAFNLDRALAGRAD